jgi:MFS transporter, DHA1 family, tetracycline resistance protein
MLGDANQSLRKRTLLILFGTLLLNMIGFGIVFPIIPTIFTNPSSPSFVLQGYSQSAQFFVAGAITALWGLMQFIAAPILGQLSDVYGRRKLLMICVGVLALSQFVFGFGISAASVVILFIARAVAGIAAGSVSITQAAIADVTEPRERAKSFGLIGAAIGIGLILGPLISGWVAGLSGSSVVPFLVAGTLGLINLLFVSLFFPETNRRQTGARQLSFLKGAQNIRLALKDAKIRPVYTTYFLYVFGFGFLIAFSGVFLVQAMGFSTTAIGTYFAFAGVCQIFTQLVLLRRLVPRYSEPVILRFTLLVAGVGLGVFSFFPNLPAQIVFTALITVAHGLTLPNLSALVSKGAAADKQGVTLGISASLLALGNTLAPLLAGVISGLFGINAPFVLGGFLILGAWTVLKVQIIKK